MNEAVFFLWGDGLFNFAKKGLPLLEGASWKMGQKGSRIIENVATDGGRKVLRNVWRSQAKEGSWENRWQRIKCFSGEANSALKRRLPSIFQIPPPLFLVDMDALKKSTSKIRPSKQKWLPSQYVGLKLKFWRGFFANDLADTWKSKVNNVAMVVDLAVFWKLRRSKEILMQPRERNLAMLGDQRQSWTASMEFHSRK